MDCYIQSDGAMNAIEIPHFKFEITLCSLTISMSGFIEIDETPTSAIFLNDLEYVVKNLVRRRVPLRQAEP